jgi:hypothetical protein
MRDPGFDNPGPGAYTMTPKFANEANKYTLHQRIGNQSDETPSPSPGPGAYLPNMDAINYPTCSFSNFACQTK